MAWNPKVRGGYGSGKERLAVPLFPLPFCTFPACSHRLGWLSLALAGAVAWGVLALHRGETISAAWLVLAAVGTYLLGLSLL